MFEDFTASQKRRNLNYVFPPEVRDNAKPMTEHHLREAHARAHDPEAVFGRALKDPIAIQARRSVNDETDVVEFVQISVLDKYSANLRRHSHVLSCHKRDPLFPIIFIIIIIAHCEETLQWKRFGESGREREGRWKPTGFCSKRDAPREMSRARRNGCQPNCTFYLKMCFLSSVLPLSFILLMTNISSHHFFSSQNF